MQINRLRHIAPQAAPVLRAPVLRLAPIAAMAGLVLMAGCREEEQNRPIHYEKGVQLQAAPLNQEASDTLRHRASKQNFGL